MKLLLILTVLLAMTFLNVGCSSMRSKKVVYDCVNTDEEALFVCDVPWLK